MATATVDIAEPARRLWTRDEYYRMDELGWFHGQRTELIGGEVVVLSPQKHQHYVAKDKAAEQLKSAFREGYWIREQGPVQCGDASEPEPDISVVHGARDDYDDHPTHAVLVVEVSDTTLQFDRRQKMSLYAKCGVGEYWIVNLIDRVLEVHRTPEADDSQPFGARYRDVQQLRPGASVSPLEKPDREIPVADLMP
jgi:Uma2 family endonuclease